MVGPGRGGGGGKMVAAQLMLVNHFFISLTHNSADVVSFPDINSVVVDMGCSHGCSRCSPINGCLACKPPFFLVLQREGTRQTASCSRSCPQGFYKLKKRRNGFCSKCTMRGCKACAGPRYCTACHHHYLNFFGTCIRQSPDNELEELRNLEKQPQHLFPGMLATIINSNRSDSSSSNRSIGNTSNVNIRNNSNNVSYNDIISAENSTIDRSIGNSDSNFSVINTDSDKVNPLPTKSYSPATTIPPTPSLSFQPPHSSTVIATASPLHTGRVKVSSTTASVPRNPCRSYWRRRSGKKRRGHKARRKDKRRRRYRGRRLRRKHRRDKTNREDRYIRKLCRRKMRRRRRRRRKEKPQSSGGDLRHELPRVSTNSERMTRNPDSESHQEPKMGPVNTHFTEGPEMIDLSLLGDRGDTSQDLHRNSSNHSRLESVHRKFIYKNRPRAMAEFKQSKQYRQAKDSQVRKIRHKTQKHKRYGRGT